VTKDSYLIFEQYRSLVVELLLENAKKAIEIKNKYYPNLKHEGEPLSDEAVEMIYNALSAQQAAKTSNLNWVLLLIQNKVPRIMEDLESIAKSLKNFDSNLGKIKNDGYPTQLFKPNKELIYKNPRELYDVVVNYIDIDESGEINLLQKAKYLTSKNEADKVYENEMYVVYTPKTYNASKELACLTNWCTRFPNMYEKYSKDGPLYIIYDKSLLGAGQDDNRMIQFHVPSKQFKDIKDREIRGRHEFMNNLKELFELLYPNVMEEYKRLSEGEIERSELSTEAKQSLYLMPQDYKENLDLPCGEIEEQIAKELGVECSDVFESEYGYEVDGAIYSTMSFADAKTDAIDTILDSGFDDDWFYKYVLGEGRGYSWEDIHSKEEYENTNGRQRIYEFEDLFGTDNYTEMYEDHLKPYLSEEEPFKMNPSSSMQYKIKLPPKNYDEYDIQDGSYLDDVPYELYIKFLEDMRGYNPIEWYLDTAGYKVRDLPIDLDQKVADYVENMDIYDVGSYVSRYDGEVYTIEIDGQDHILYRTD
jgi:hypothetical protein